MVRVWLMVSICHTTCFPQFPDNGCAANEDMARVNRPRVRKVVADFFINLFFLIYHCEEFKQPLYLYNTISSIYTDEYEMYITLSFSTNLYHIMNWEKVCTFHKFLLLIRKRLNRLDIDLIGVIFQYDRLARCLSYRFPYS